MPKIIICKSCKKKKLHEAKGLCRKCYKKQNLKICSSCGELKPYVAKGLCQSCYDKQRKRPLIICKKCKKKKEHKAHGLCHNCFCNLINHKTGKNQPMSENKECAQYLGIVVAEQVLSKVFKGVTQMPPNNAGYDFICNQGKKIDVKSSVLQFNKNYNDIHGHWSFTINKNTTPNYFLCIAFDNRKDLNPLHLWLIPSKKVSHKKTLSISKLNILKYFQYSQSIDKITTCCNTLKGD